MLLESERGDTSWCASGRGGASADPRTRLRRRLRRCPAARSAGTDGEQGSWVRRPPQGALISHADGVRGGTASWGRLREWHKSWVAGVDCRSIARKLRWKQRARAPPRARSQQRCNTRPFSWSTGGRGRAVRASSDDCRCGGARRARRSPARARSMGRDRSWQATEFNGGRWTAGKRAINLWGSNGRGELCPNVARTLIC